MHTTLGAVLYKVMHTSFGVHSVSHALLHKRLDKALPLPLRSLGTRVLPFLVIGLFGQNGKRVVWNLGNVLVIHGQLRL